MNDSKDLETRCRETFRLEKEEDDADCFRAPNLFHARQSVSGAAYGGLVFAQGLAAAELTVDRQFKPNSLHSYFVLPVNASLAVTYKVRRIRDGKSFVTRIVEAKQKDKLCFILQVSFHKPEKESMIHQELMPRVPRPETLRSMREAVISVKRLVDEGRIVLKPAMLYRLEVFDWKAYVQQEDFFELRCTDLDRYYGISNDRKPAISFWMRARGALPDDERLHRWLIACISDSILIPAAISPHFSQGFEGSLHVSLDHCLWFHTSEVRADEWLLFEGRSSVSSGARCMMEGRFWTSDGRLVASCQQEGLNRGKRGQSSRI